MKKCSVCRDEKPLDEYYKHKLKKDGHADRCKECAKRISKEWRQDNRDRHRAYAVAYYQENREALIERDKLRREIDPEYFREWRKNNKGLVNSYTNKRSQRTRRATPRWLTESDMNVIHSLYKDAAQFSLETGTPHHVDHIVPLQGKSVSGLNVPWNLQVIPAKENLRKRNSFNDWRDFPESIS